MTTNDFPQGMVENTIPLLLGHPDPATLLTVELLDAMQQAIQSPQCLAASQFDNLNTTGLC